MKRRCSRCTDEQESGMNLLLSGLRTALWCLRDQETFGLHCEAVYGEGTLALAWEVKWRVRARILNVAQSS